MQPTTVRFLKSNGCFCFDTTSNVFYKPIKTFAFLKKYPLLAKIK